MHSRLILIYQCLLLFKVVFLMQTFCHLKKETSYGPEPEMHLILVKYLRPPVLPSQIYCQCKLVTIYSILHFMDIFTGHITIFICYIQALMESGRKSFTLSPALKSNLKVLAHLPKSIENASQAIFRVTTAQTASSCHL